MIFAALFFKLKTIPIFVVVGKGYFLSMFKVQLFLWMLHFNLQVFFKILFKGYIAELIFKL